MSKVEPKDLEQYGLKDVVNVIYNPSYSKLAEDEKAKGECSFSDNQTAMVDTGIFTGRSPKDKYFVKQSPSQEHIAWGDINQPISKEVYNDLFKLTTEQLSGKELYVIDAFAGASKSSRKSIRFITEIAWQAHFIENMFIMPSEEELENFEPDFVMLHTPKTTDPKWKEHGLNSEVYVAFNLKEGRAAVGGTWAQNDGLSLTHSTGLAPTAASNSSGEC